MLPMARKLVTGGAGFIGSHIVTALVERGEEVRVLDDLSSGTPDNLAHLEVGGLGSGARVELMRADVRDPEACAAACAGVDGIFHEAAQVSVPASIEDPVGSYDINVNGTLRVLEAARTAGVRKVVFAASSAAYGDDPTCPKVETMTPRPLSPYASGKLAGEGLMEVYGRAFGIQTVCLRYFNVFGPRQADDSPYSGVIAIFARELLAGRVPTIHGTGAQTRDFVYVGDVVQANLLAMDGTVEPGTVFNVGTGARVSIKDLVVQMGRTLGRDVVPEHGPARAGDVPDSQADISRLRGLGFEPRTPWPAGLEPTLAWYRERFGG